ncbi:MAG: PEP/pyruvate-binding domain-containing protein [Acidobacteriota bacterium]|nr:PEP/pyruvate-binding domain-containing protein [Acidobacteriota bacterium]
MSLAGSRLFAYQSLMPFLVKDILLVASSYDRFIVEEDGRFADRLLSQYVEMDLSTPPHFDHVATAREALERLDERRYDLVLSTPHCAGMTPRQLAQRVSRLPEPAPTVVLAYDRSDAQLYTQQQRSSGIDQVFLWTGDPSLLVALVKSVEDMRNVDHDTDIGQVRVILLVEDSPLFFSSYLPIIYAEVLGQVKSLLAERLNERDRHQRMRARPKILLARNYEEGVELFQRYSDNLLGTICDMRFPRGGILDDRAGLRFIRLVREQQPDVPVLLQSSQSGHRQLAEELEVHFADKNSRRLLDHLRRFMRTDLGFGSFVFRNARGERELEASNMEEMLRALGEVSDESLRFHASRNHISNWLMARSEFALAQEVRPKKVSDFRSTGAMRAYLREVFTSFLEREQQGEITEFDRQGGYRRRDFERLGSGSMGGKARSIAFVSHTLAEHRIHQKYPQVRITAPSALVICTGLFDQFCSAGGLRQRLLDAEDDEAVLRCALDQQLDSAVLADLRAYLERVRHPMAVRSSSLHEDSESQPLAGLYKTFMLPNSDPSLEVRLEQLSRAIRLIYASAYVGDARRYLEAHDLRLEEEKMAVVLQRLVGRRHGKYFYPDFAGVAQSHNYYPMGYMKPEDGIASVALGFGQAIVEGRRALRFCPRYPEVLPQMASPEEALKVSQRKFYSLDLSRGPVAGALEDHANLQLRGLEAAEDEGALEALVSTYVAESDAVYDTIYRSGPRIVTFAGVLKHGRFPLAPLLQDLLELWREGMGTEVEMEFAVSLGDDGQPAEMAILQLRPLVVASEETSVNLRQEAYRGHLLGRGSALGNGIIRDLRHVIYVHPDRFDFSRSSDTAAAVGRLNHALAARGEGYLLIGPGRWGTADPWLGIPVAWRQVASARVIVELVRPGSHIDPSQGTHFFHNLTALRTGYFEIDEGGGPEGGEGTKDRLDLEYLDSLPAEHEQGALRHVVLPEPVTAFIDGRQRRGLLMRRPAEA